MNLNEIITNNLLSNKYNLTIKQINWINAFIQGSPEVLKVITDNITDIISDGKIDIHDIPKIINIITNIYYNNALRNEIVNPDNIIIFVKFTLDSIIELNLFLSEIEKENIQKLINSSLDLIKLNINKENTNCCSIFNFYTKH